ncbi:hypothetical protein J1614_006062 [Plenodomus biglobosus]|nr:hypothetical protein J1614_006062 [Plenodomus biglobosus]
MGALQGARVRPSQWGRRSWRGAGADEHAMRVVVRAAGASVHRAGRRAAGQQGSRAAEHQSTRAPEVGSLEASSSACAIRGIPVPEWLG